TCNKIGINSQCIFKDPKIYKYIDEITIIFVSPGENLANGIFSLINTPIINATIAITSRANTFLF
ncbi:hypothetical protein, partial [Bacillus cereus group sp. BfR-BA-01454]